MILTLPRPCPSSGKPRAARRMDSGRRGGLAQSASADGAKVASSTAASSSWRSFLLLIISSSQAARDSEYPIAGVSMAMP
jgi:hypothetical protein